MNTGWNDAAAVRAEMVARIGALNPGEGITDSPVEGVRLMHSRRSIRKSPVTYQPGIVLIVQGRKCGHVGGKRFVYDADNYLVHAVPLPFACETFASVAEPLYGISVGVNAAMVAEIVMGMENPPEPLPAGPEAMRAFPVDDGMRGAALRLLRAMGSKDESRILGPDIVREIVYRVLRGGDGGTLSALASTQGHYSQICRVLGRIHSSYAAAPDVANLAREAGLGVSAFHEHFRHITGTTPLQYVKQIRLNEAFSMMMMRGLGAGEAAHNVGYESVSQFSREFRRAYGDSPAAFVEKRRAERLGGGRAA